MRGDGLGLGEERTASVPCCLSVPPTEGYRDLTSLPNYSVSSQRTATGYRLPKVPAMLIPLMPGRPERKSAPEQAAMYGSIIQATWSFFLALRERGLGSVWMSAATRRERAASEILRIPFDQYTQIGWFPIAGRYIPRIAKIAGRTDLNLLGRRSGFPPQIQASAGAG